MAAQIRNFSIIAHIDHGKSTLADRMLEETKSVEARKMQDQMLDSMELERERGITIKMQPVRILYETGGEEYILNLIDTPGHIDFSYEVSRALKAVEGVLLLVDSTQGVQAQTLTTLEMAKESNLKIIPVLTKTDVPHARIEEVGEELVRLLDCDPDEIMLVSGKTGDGVPELLKTIAREIPPPAPSTEETYRGMIFDFQYDNHRGIIVFMRVFDGAVQKGDELKFAASGKTFTALEVGVVTPAEKPVEQLSAGHIGYIVTGIKEPGVAGVGDTLMPAKSQTKPLAGYKEAHPVVWSSVFPENQDEFTQLRQSLDRLKLSDSSLSYEEESSGVLGRGFRCGFLGMLHMEIITERLRREFNLELVLTTPSISYEVTWPDGRVEHIYAANRFPEHGEKVSVREPWILGQIILPSDYMGNVMQLLFEHEATVIDTEVFSDGRTLLSVEMPLRELMRGFFDRLKNASSGYASLSYEIAEMRDAFVTKLDILISEEVVPAFSRVVGMNRADVEAKEMTERLYRNLPKQQFVVKIQAKVMGSITATKKISALKKDVTGHLYGGDITRKMKLREKQKKGKAKALQRGKVHIPQDVFMKMMKGD